MEEKAKGIRKLKRRLNTLEKQFKALGPVMRGSIVKLNMQTGDKKYPANYFSAKINKKTKLIYLGEKKLNKAKEYNDNYLKLKVIIEEMTKTLMELIRLSK